MKHILLLSLYLITANLYSQTNDQMVRNQLRTDRKIHTIEDSIPIIVNAKTTLQSDNALYYLDGQLVDRITIGSINPAIIDKVEVEKENVTIDSIEYSGKIHIESKEKYQPKLISLNSLKKKYTDIEDNKPTLFLLDDQVIYNNYDHILIDEKYILKIEVHSIENTDEAINLNLIKLTTRSEENLAKINTIRLKGKHY